MPLCPSCGTVGVPAARERPAAGSGGGRPRAAEIAPRPGYRMQGPVATSCVAPIPGMTATATSAGSSA